jgi:hypothetical protein
LNSEERLRKERGGSTALSMPCASLAIHVKCSAPRFTQLVQHTRLGVRIVLTHTSLILFLQLVIDKSLQPHPALGHLFKSSWLLYSFNMMYRHLFLLMLPSVMQSTSASTRPQGKGYKFFLIPLSCERLLFCV